MSIESTITLVICGILMAIGTSKLCLWAVRLFRTLQGAECRSFLKCMLPLSHEIGVTAKEELALYMILANKRNQHATQNKSPKIFSKGNSKFARRIQARRWQSFLGR